MLGLEVNIDQYINSFQFANDVIKSNLDHYNSRKQGNFKKIHQDIALGKIAEYAVYNYLTSKGKKPSEVDLKVYSKKSYSADLTAGEAQIHIKSCRENGNSWVFQKNDPLVLNPTENDFIFLCKHNKGKVDIIKIIKGLEANYLNPRLKHLISKVCIYN